MRHLVSAIALLGLCAGCVEPPPPPPPGLVSQLTASVPADNPNCQEYRTPATVDGQPQQLVGRACRQPDGSWRMDPGMGPAPVISQYFTRVDPDNPYCRDYSAVANFGGEQQPIVGRACELPDGSWQVTQGTPEQPVQVSIVYPMLPVYADYPYGPWGPWWGPPFVAVGATFVFVHHHGGHFVGHGGWGGHGGRGGGGRR